VSGATISADVATLNVEDKNITLNQGSSDTSATADGAGITIQDAVDASNDATLLWNAANDKFVFSHLIEAPGTSIFTNLDISGDVDVDGTLETDALSINGTAVSSTAAELNILDGVTATTAEINLIDGGTARGTTAVADGDGILTNDGGTMRMTKVETFATYFGAEIASNRMVVADIDVSSLTDDLRATITHNLGTADVMVQLYDKTTEATVYADIGRTTDDFSTASTSVITVDFGTTPPNDIRCVITSLADAASGSVAYT